MIQSFTQTALWHSFSQVTQLASYFDPLIVASVGLASKLHDHQQQMTILDQTKTLSESALQMLYAAKEGGGNPKVQISSCSCLAYCARSFKAVTCDSKLNFSNAVFSYGIDLWIDR